MFFPQIKTIFARRQYKNTAVFFILLFIVIYICLPLFEKPHNVNLDEDWTFNLFTHRFVKESILNFKQFPLRCPFVSGGYPLIAHPLDGALSPFILPVLLLGEAAGLKFNIFIFYLTGAFGMYYLTRKILHFDYIGSLLSTLTFFLSLSTKGLTAKLLSGEYELGYWLFLPFVFGFFIKSKKNSSYLIWASLMLALALTQAGPSFILLLFFLFLYSLVETSKTLFTEKKLQAVWLKQFTIAVLLTLLFGAVKILPMLELLLINPRAVGPDEMKLGLFLLEMRQTGPLLLGLAAIGTFFYLKKTFSFLILALIFAWFSLANISFLNLYQLISRLPIFNAMESDYYFKPLEFSIVLLAGMTVTLLRKKRNKLLNLTLTLLVLTHSANLIYINRGILKKIFPINPSVLSGSLSFSEQKGVAKREIAPSKSHPWNLIPYDIEVTKLQNPAFIPAKVPKKNEQLFHVKLINPDERSLPLKGIDYFNLSHNIGTLNWNASTMTLREYARPKYFINSKGNLTLNSEYKGEIYFLNPGNRAKISRFTPNKIAITVNVRIPDKLIINQNYDKYWKSSKGILKPHQGLLSIDIKEKGSYTIYLNYVSKAFILGLSTTLLTILCFIGYWLRRTLAISFKVSRSKHNDEPI